VGQIAIGKSALTALGAPGENTAVGYQAGLTLSSGASNQIFGWQAATALTTGSTNVAMGRQTCGISGTALEGSNNTCVGDQAGSALQGAATQNTLIGKNAGDNITTGSYNTMVGVNADSSANAVDYEICLGVLISGDGTETCRIGRSSDYITNDFGENATWTHSSDVRIKKDIEDNELGLDFIKDLRTVTFKKKAPSEYPKEFDQHSASDTERKNPDMIHYGFIAQEVKKAMDKAGHSEFTVWGEQGDGMQVLGETEFITPLIKAVQELSAKIEELESKLK